MSKQLNMLPIWFHRPLAHHASVLELNGVSELFQRSTAKVGYVAI